MNMRCISISRCIDTHSRKTEDLWWIHDVEQGLVKPSTNSHHWPRDYGDMNAKLSLVYKYGGNRALLVCSSE